MDAVTMSALATTAGTVISLVKSLSDASKTMDSTKLGSVIIELQQAVMEMQQNQQELFSA